MQPKIITFQPLETPHITVYLEDGQIKQRSLHQSVPQPNHVVISHHIGTNEPNTPQLVFVIQLTKDIAITVALSKRLEHTFLFNPHIRALIAPAYNHLYQLGPSERKYGQFDNKTGKQRADHIQHLRSQMPNIPDCTRLLQTGIHVGAFVIKPGVALQTGALPSNDTINTPKKPYVFVHDWRHLIETHDIPEFVNDLTLDKQLVFYYEWFMHEFIHHQINIK